MLTPFLIDARRSFGRVTANLIMDWVWADVSFVRLEESPQTYLIWGELVLELLITLESTELHREHAITSSLDQWQVPELKIDVVLRTIVVID